MSQDLTADLTADLLRDLEGPGGADVSPSPSSRASTTPALSLTLTPLRWSWPAVHRADTGTGLLVRLGPWQVAVIV